MFQFMVEEWDAFLASVKLVLNLSVLDASSFFPFTSWIAYIN